MEAQIKVNGTHHWEADKKAGIRDSDAKLKKCDIACKGQNTVHVTARTSIRTRWEKRVRVEYAHREMKVFIDGNPIGQTLSGFKSERELEDNYWEIVKAAQEQMEMNLNAPVALRGFLSSIAKKG